MDISLFDYIAPGAVMLSQSNHSIVNFFNPSEEKHSSLYFGYGIVDFIIKNDINFSINGLNNFTNYIIEFNTSGFAIIPLREFMLDRKYVKVYYYMEGIFPNYRLMEDTVKQAFLYANKEYGFGKNKTYCFKMIADCYLDIGINVKPYKILGKYLYLSQSFCDDDRWTKVLDTLTGENLITRNSYYFIR